MDSEQLRAMATPPAVFRAALRVPTDQGLAAEATRTAKICGRKPITVARRLHYTA